MSDYYSDLAEYINGRSGLDALTVEQVKMVYVGLGAFGLKQCSMCCEVKPLDDFSKDRKAKDGKNVRCKPCGVAHTKAWALSNPEHYAEVGRAWRESQKAINPDAGKRAMRKHRYQLTQDDYEQMLADQSGLCANPNCFNEPSATIRFEVDHDHACCPGRGKTCGECIRGLLCSPCNRALGAARDDAKRLRGLADYLEGERRYDRRQLDIPGAANTADAG